MKSLLNWLDDRTGFRGLLREALYERVPGGARWRYVWGSTLVFAFVTQAITGIVLWMAYSPSGTTAWESVYYIQHEMTGGWLLRGIHHFMAQAMVVLLALHLMQVVIDGAYRAPREVNFWLGLILMMIVLGLSLTGYLLPWDQKGYWATRVATNLAALVPLVGPDLQKLIVGSSDYGHHTLTRFFALHAGVLPALLVFFLVLHVAIFRRHGLHPKEPIRRPDAMFWPDQVLKDAVACLAVLAVVLFLVFRPALMGTMPEGAAAGDYLGAHLDAPADRTSAEVSPRPEWYFLFLFQFLKLFEGMGETGELLGAIVVPGLLMGILFLMPILGRWKLGHRFNVGFLFCVVLGAVLLTGQALWDDQVAALTDPPGAEASEHARARYEASQKHLAAVRLGEQQAHRAVELARSPQGIPPEGILSLLAHDPKSQGPRLFATYCASCHDHTAPAGVTESQGAPFFSAESSAPDLGGFASRAWIAGLLDKEQIATPRYFGNTAHASGDMVNFVKDSFEADLQTIAAIAAALSAEAALPEQQAADAADAALIATGRQQIKAAGCLDCHKFGSEGDLGSAPDLTGYGSAAWLRGIIGNPTHEAFYGENNDRMPAFAESDDPTQNKLSPEQLDLLVRWLRGDWYRAAAGQ